MMCFLIVACALVVVIVDAGWINPGTPPNVPEAFDCAARSMMHEYGCKLLPRRGSFASLYDALQLQNCPSSSSISRASGGDEWQPPPSSVPTTDDAEYSNDAVWFVDPTHGVDGGGGGTTIDAPMRTIAAALTASRERQREHRHRNHRHHRHRIVLRAGTHYIARTLMIDRAEDAGLEIVNHPGERAVISGAVPLPVPTESWSPYLLEKDVWQTMPGWDAVTGRAVSRNHSECCRFMGIFGTMDECASTVMRMVAATGYAYYTPEFDSGAWARQCFAMVDGAWHPAPGSKGVVSARHYSRNTWVANISALVPSGTSAEQIQGLRLNGRRVIRAKYPNGDPEMSGNWFRVTNPLYGTGTYTKGWITAPTDWRPPQSPLPPQTDVVVSAVDWPDVEWPMSEPDNDTWTGMGDHGDFHVGVGGGCAGMGVPVGYWCAAHPPRGDVYTHRSPTGVSMRALPNAPYKNVSRAVVQAWRGGGRWYTWQFEVTSTGDDDVMLFSATRGGNQGGEGSPVGAEWWIENVLEECDDANEWYHDATNGLLYFNFNASVGDGPRGDEVWDVPTHATVIRIHADDVTVRGVEVRDTRITYLDSETIGLPSGGDWAVHQSAAVMLGNGAERVTIADCYLHNIDGNAVYVGGRARNVSIVDNEIAWLGSSAIVLWGNTSECMNANCSVRVGHPVGPDGRGGNHPQRTFVGGNYVHDVGVYQKQSSMYFQAIATESTIAGNVFVNGPRAGINLNDGFGGGDVIRGNLLANMVRESGDHAPFNSWNRLPYITTLRTGAPSIVPANRYLSGNAVFANYASQLAIDNDDGSSRYQTSGNVLVYGIGGIKSDFGGNHNHHFRNVYAYLSMGCYMIGGGAGTNDAFYNNTCIVNRAGGGYASDCNTPLGMRVHDNRVFTLDGTDTVCGMSLRQWIALGHDPGTSIGVMPPTDIIVTWMRQLLKL